jgi:peptide/nickel transport system substrate-binding protein
MLLLAGAAGLSSCGGGGAAPAGAQLIVARVKDAVDLDPAVATDGLSLNIASEVLEGLVTFKPGTFEVQPAIATHWTTSPDGKRWSFELRAGRTFSDGTPLDAKAVAFNVDRWRNPKNGYRGNFAYSYYETMFGPYPSVITAVHADDPTHVTFTLSRPFAPFLRDLAMPSFTIGSPAAIKTDVMQYDRKPVGSGPYTLAEWVKDDHITLAANPAYRPAPAYTTVIVRDIPDQATSVLSLQKGDIDGLTDPRPDDAATLAKQPGVTIYQQPSNNLSYLAFNVTKKPFDDVRVRRALAYAIDVPAIVKGLYAQGALVADDWLPPAIAGKGDNVHAYPHDVARAKALLAQAGLPSGFSVQLYYGTAPRPYMPEPQRVAEAIQADLRAIGVNVILAPFEWGVFLSKIKNGEHAMCLIGWTGDNGDPDNFLYPLLDKDSAIKGGQNYSFWTDAAFHALMLQGQATVDPARRAAIYARAVQRVSDQVPAVALVHTTVPLAMKSSVAGVIPRPDSILNFEFMKPKAP